MAPHWINPCWVQFRLAATMTLLLTVAAKQAYISRLLPKVAFLTPPEVAVNATVALLFVQAWFHCAASQLCYEGKTRRKYYDEEREDRPRWAPVQAGDSKAPIDAARVDAVAKALTLVVFLGCLSHAYVCVRRRRKIRENTLAAVAARDDSYFREYQNNCTDFRNEGLSEELTDGCQMTRDKARRIQLTETNDDEDYRVVVFDVGTGEAKALRYTFTRARGVEVTALAQRAESLAEALAAGGERAETFGRWFSEALYHDCDLQWSGDGWASAGIAWDGPRVASVAPGARPATTSRRGLRRDEERAAEPTRRIFIFFKDARRNGRSTLRSGPRREPPPQARPPKRRASRRTGCCETGTA